MLRYGKHLSTVAWIPATALMVLLVALATLQYKWLGELSDSELELTQAALRTAAQRFSEDFDSELTSAFVNLQMNRAFVRSGQGEDYAKIYDQWAASTPYPKLISRLYFIEAREDGEWQLFSFNDNRRQLEPAVWPANLEALQRRLAEQFQEMLAPNRSAEANPLTLIDGEIPALIIPMAPRIVAEEQAERSQRGSPAPTMYSHIIAVLDLDYLKQEVIPALARRYFSGGADDRKLNYDLLIVSRQQRARTIYSSALEAHEPPNSEAEVKIELFRLRPQLLARLYTDKFLSLTSSAPDETGARELRPNLPLTQNLRRDFLRQVFKTSVEGQWELILTHRAGSLQKVVADIRGRNLLIGFGVLVLLSASLVMIFMLSRRMHRLAKQQMEFVAGVSHELRTPVAVLCSASENLADGLIHSREEVIQYSAMIRNESYRLADLVEHVLEFAGTQSMGQLYQLSPVAVEEIIESTLALSAHHLASRGFTVQKDFSPHVSFVLADRAALGRAIQNLLDNAMKFSGEHKLITVRIQTSQGRDGEEALISVEDYGMGIEPDELKQIFEPFRRGKAAIASQIHGSGLGLSLVKHIAEGHHGKVSVRSIPGQGSTFTLHLPVVAEPFRQ